jgi:hypothetical protein
VDLAGQHQAPQVSRVNDKFFSVSSTTEKAHDVGSQWYNSTPTDSRGPGAKPTLKEARQPFRAAQPRSKAVSTTVSDPVVRFCYIWSHPRNGSSTWKVSGDPLTPETNRPWTVSEVQDELEILCDAADLDWREEFESVLYHQRYKLHCQGEHLALAKAHVEENRILSLEEISRLSLYGRQLNATLKSLVNQLERHRALRLGQVVPPPLAVDLTLSPK